MDLADHLRTIAANWWRILLIAVIVGAGVYGYSKQQTNTYRASELVSVAPELNVGTPIDQQSLAFRVAAFAQLLRADVISQGAVADGKLHRDYKAVQSSLSMVTNSVGGLILIQSTAHSTTEALATVDALAKSLAKSSQIEAANENQKRIDQDKAGIARDDTLLADQSLSDQAKQQIRDAKSQLEVDVANRQANAPTGSVRLQTSPQLDNNGAPIAPLPGRDGLLAFLVAFVVAAEGFVIVRALSDRVSKAADVATITELTGLPVLAQVPRGSGPEVVEAFRTLRTNLMFLEGSGRPRTIALLSPNPGAGKSFCATHLAESAVAVDAQVVLVDADLRRPVLHTRLRVDREPGLSDTLRGGPLADSLHRVEGFSNLRLVPSGSQVTDTAAALGGRAFRAVLDALDDAELVIVDTPPGGGYADALAISAQCDAGLLVLDAQTTRRRATEQFIEALERTGASLIGVILNSATVSKRDTYDRS